MGWLNSLFGSSQPQSIHDLRRVVADLTQQGKFTDAVRSTAQFRERIERTLSHSDADRTYENGYANALAMRPLFQSASKQWNAREDEQEFFNTLKAFYACFTSMFIALQAAESGASAERLASINALRDEATELYERSHKEFDEDFCREADNAANDAINAGFKKYR